MPSEKDRLASEAQRLLNEPLLVDALDQIMSDAFAEFKTMKLTPDTIHEAIALQQRILATHQIHDLLEAKILASGQVDGGMQVENKPSR